MPFSSRSTAVSSASISMASSRPFEAVTTMGSTLHSLAMSASISTDAWEKSARSQAWRNGAILSWCDWQPVISGIAAARATKANFDRANIRHLLENVVALLGVVLARFTLRVAEDLAGVGVRQLEREAVSPLGLLLAQPCLPTLVRLRRDLGEQQVVGDQAVPPEHGLELVARLR